MKKHLLTLLSLFMIFALETEAVITPTTNIQDVIPSIQDKDTLVLFNIAEVLMDTETSLGTGAWRKYIRKKIDSQQHDILTFFVAKKVPPKIPEAGIQVLVNSLQHQGFPVLAFTSRGRAEWYATQVDGVDQLTEKLLNNLGIDLSKSNLPKEWAQLDSTFGQNFHAGILYAGNLLEKGEFLKLLLEQTGYKPKKIVFVDDKADSLKTVETAMAELAIPFEGFAYNRTSLDHQNFDPMIAHIQLESLLFKDTFLTDEEALQIKKNRYADIDPDQFFEDLIHKIDFNTLKSTAFDLLN